MSNEDERRLILEMIDSGKITAEEGLGLLQALPTDQVDDFDEAVLPAFADEPTSGSAQPAETIAAGIPPVEMPEAPVQENDGLYSQPGAQQAIAPDFNRWRRFWAYPFWAGVGVTILGSLLMFWAQQATGMSFWFFCAGIPFTLGIILMVVAWQSRSARWLHLRVQQRTGEWPQNFAISIPLPLRVSGWFMRTFRHRIPGMENSSVDIEAVMAALEQSTSPDNPLYVEVEEDDGERVQIFIG
jgi:hypothetical protein